MKNSLNKNDFYNFLSEAFPQVSNLFEIRNLSPGNVISGPTMFLLADVSFYLSILSKIGPESLAVTTNCSIDFLRKPSEKNLYSENRILKIGKSLCVGDVLIYSVDLKDPVAHASLTYSIPPKKSF